MEYRNIRKIAVLGAGTMGAYIAQFFASAGYQVSLYSRTQRTLEMALALVRETQEGADPDLYGDRPCLRQRGLGD